MARGLRLGVVCARWNPTVTDGMLESALDTLRRRGALERDVVVVRVPGAFEVPAGVRSLIDTGRPDAVVALAAIVRGETSHHSVLGHSVAGALASLAAQTGVPVGFGILTCDTMEQARGRVEKGVEAAEAAIEMANLRKRLKQEFKR
ncbi:MAG TPA: 6,7-dimethyl-8-ribityllumazine synthase [Thermoanaerobaculia bacterium]|nr:6,7-dimethyl-8-ribityllumazine synthase [Thermoanaerobaculia bacterium]